MRFFLSFGALLIFTIPWLGEIKATELAPWFSEEYEFQSRLSYSYQPYEKVRGDSRYFPYSSHDQIANLSLGITPKTNWNVEIERQGASTKRSNFRLDLFRATGRYLFLDDVGGVDPVSLSLGLTLSVPLACALHDVSLLFRSRLDSELHIAIGKEFACGPCWDYRVWGLLGVGTGVKGAPWLHTILKGEKNFSNRHRLGISAEYIYGSGNQQITDPFQFQGYSLVAYRGLDLCLDYAYAIPFVGEFYASYTKRVAASNLPYDLQIFTFGLLWTFSIGSISF